MDSVLLALEPGLVKDHVEGFVSRFETTIVHGEGFLDGLVFLVIQTIPDSVDLLLEVMADGVDVGDGIAEMLILTVLAVDDSLHGQDLGLLSGVVENACPQIEKQDADGNLGNGQKYLCRGIILDEIGRQSAEDGDE